MADRPSSKRGRLPLKGRFEDEKTVLENQHG